MLVEFSEPALARVAILFALRHAKNNQPYKSTASHHKRASRRRDAEEEERTLRHQVISSMYVV
jgi:hypothetical protein